MAAWKLVGNNKNYFKRRAADFPRSGIFFRGYFVLWTIMKL